MHFNFTTPEWIFISRLMEIFEVPLTEKSSVGNHWFANVHFSLNLAQNRGSDEKPCPGTVTPGVPLEEVKGTTLYNTDFSS